MIPSAGYPEFRIAVSTRSFDSLTQLSREADDHKIDSVFFVRLTSTSTSTRMASKPIKATECMRDRHCRPPADYFHKCQGVNS